MTRPDISPIDAERAFAADAKTIGQWTAFRKWSTDDAVMFVPQPVNAHEWLKDRKDPAKSVRWQPISSYVACDGKWAVNTGAWWRADGSVGYFTTVWHKERIGWRWVLDSGDGLSAARPVPAKPAVRIAKCGGDRRTGFGSEPNSGYGSSDDATLRWRWHVAADNGREVVVELWNGKRYDAVIDDKIAGSPANK
ncbi:MAG: hypothetical protein JSR79_02485 [Proteobacteria bacterium]|nr:hypothetical protein [Pseudomonadota bacterium]